MLQYLDDLDDLFAAIGLLAESIRSFIIALFFLTATLTLQVAGILLALRQPTLALATALLLGVLLLYRSVTTESPRLRPSA
jgi:hypothetical protein